MKKLLSILVIALMSFQNLWAQCAMCKASAETSMESSQQAAGINTGILYSLVFVALSIVFFIFLFLRGNHLAKSN